MSEPISDAAHREATLFIQSDFDAAELSQRRRRAMDAMIGGGAALIAGVPGMPGMQRLRQFNEFYYLTGLDVLGAYLLMDADRGESTLYLPPRNAKLEDIDGPMLCDEDTAFVVRHTGIKNVRPVHTLSEEIRNLTKFWLLRDPAEGPMQCQDSLRGYRRRVMADPLNGLPSAEEWLQLRLAQLCPRAHFSDLSGILATLRLIKSGPERKLMRAAGDLTARATLEAMRSTRPGIYEYQLAAVADYVFGMAGALGGGYVPIIATGANIWAMHYWRGNTRLRDGELVLFDYAPDYRYYTSDIGRMWPVNGIYSPVQRELYGLVIEYHKVFLRLIRPGITADDLLNEAAAVFRPTVESWSFSRDIYRSAAFKLLESKRPVSHAVGMAVHDAGNYKHRPLQPGDVWALDPELFIHESREYIRCEDTILITDTGYENLTASCPLEMDEVERVVREGNGMIQQFPMQVV